MNSKELEAPMSDTLMNWTSRAAVARRVAEERRRPESWNELTILTIRDDDDLPLDKAEYQTRPAKWPWQVYII